MISDKVQLVSLVYPEIWNSDWKFAEKKCHFLFIVIILFIYLCFINSCLASDRVSNLEWWMVFPVLRMNAKIMSFHWKVIQITSLLKKREKKVPLDGKVAVGRELGEQDDVDDALL